MKVLNFKNFINESVRQHLKGKQMDELFENPTISILHYFKKYDDDNHSKEEIKEIISKIPEIKNINSLYNEIINKYGKEKFNKIVKPELIRTTAEYIIYIVFDSNNRYCIGIRYDEEVNGGSSYYFIDDFKSYEFYDTIKDLRKEVFRLIRTNL